MTNAEKRALTEAFRIPESQKKRQFIAEYKELAKDRKKRLIPPVFLKIASAAAACAVICGVWLNVRKNTDIKLESSDTDNISIVEVSEDETTVADEKKPEKEDNNAALITSSTTTSAGKGSKTSKKNGENKTTVTTAEKQDTEKTNDKSDDNTSSGGTTAKQQGRNETSSSSSVKHENTKTTATSTTKQEKTRTTTTTEKRITTTTTVKSEEPEPGTDIPDVPTPVSGVKPIQDGKDKTLIPWKTYNDNNVVSIYDLDPYSNGGFAGGGTGGVGPPDQGWQQNGQQDRLINRLIDQSDHMIRGRVENILYTSANGVAYTQLDIYVTEVMRDDSSLVSGDRISVRFIGGYISAREYCERMGWETNVSDDSVVYEESDNYCIPDIGSEYLMFLNDGGYNIPDGGFTFPLNTDSSILEPDFGGYSTLDHRYYVSSYDLNNMI